jgi:hypothetical protein
LTRWSPEYDLVLARLHRAGQTDYQITSNMLDQGLPVAREDVTAARRRLHLPQNRPPQVGERQPPTPKEKPNPLGIAAIWLGRRLKERPQGYFLDGVHVGLKTIMRETNRLLKDNGCEQITTHPDWIVPSQDAQ